MGDTSSVGSDAYINSQGSPDFAEKPDLAVLRSQLLSMSFLGSVLEGGELWSNLSPMVVFKN